MTKSERVALVELREKISYLKLGDSDDYDEHRRVRDDDFYSCPKSWAYTGHDEKVCNCGLEDRNAQVESVLKLIDDLLKE